jgi:hypothetical protein
MTSTVVSQTDTCSPCSLGRLLQVAMAIHLLGLLALPHAARISCPVSREYCGANSKSSPTGQGRQQSRPRGFIGRQDCEPLIKIMVAHISAGRESDLALHVCLKSATRHAAAVEATLRRPTALHTPIPTADTRLWWTDLQGCAPYETAVTSNRQHRYIQLDTRSCLFTGSVPLLLLHQSTVHIPCCRLGTRYRSRKTHTQETAYWLAPCYALAPRVRGNSMCRFTFCLAARRRLRTCVNNGTAYIASRMGAWPSPGAAVVVRYARSSSRSAARS